MADFDEAVRLSPGDAFARGSRGVAWLARQDVVRAQADFDEAIRLEPRNPAYLIDRAAAWRAKGDYDRAIADCDAALRLDPRSVTAMILRASIRSERKEYDGAIADYNEIIRHDPMVFLNAYLGRATAQGEKGEYDAVISGLDQLIRIEPKLPDTYVVRAAGWKHKNQYEKAIADLTKPSDSTRKTREPTTIASIDLGRAEAVRQGDCRLHAGDSAGAVGGFVLLQPRLRL